MYTAGFVFYISCRQLESFLHPAGSLGDAILSPASPSDFSSMTPSPHPPLAPLKVNLVTTTHSPSKVGSAVQDSAPDEIRDVAVVAHQTGEGKTEDMNMGEGEEMVAGSSMCTSHG